jgi:hypothetical protein
MSFSKLTHVLCRKNFVKVLVYFEDLNYELIEEEPEIEVNMMFVSDLPQVDGFTGNFHVALVQ